jgi:5-methylcytosine-specific restriction endonuclease McrA
MKTLHIDHIKPMKLYPELEFLSSNLQVLCSRCNAHKSAYDGHDWKEVVADRRKATLRRRAKAKLNSDANSS